MALSSPQTPVPGPVGPGSHPSMAPVPPPGGMQATRRRTPAGTLLALALVLLVTVVIVVLAITVWSGDDGSGSTTEQAPVGDNWPNTGMRSPGEGGEQGMMSTLLMENHR